MTEFVHQDKGEPRVAALKTPERAGMPRNMSHLKGGGKVTAGCWVSWENSWPSNEPYLPPEESRPLHIAPPILFKKTLKLSHSFQCFLPHFWCSSLSICSRLVYQFHIRSKLCCLFPLGCLGAFALAWDLQKAGICLWLLEPAWCSALQLSQCTCMLVALILMRQNAVLGVGVWLMQYAPILPHSHAANLIRIT